MIVFDQAFRGNSYISLLNTNVWREGSFTDANVTGTEFQINTRKVTYGVSGSGILTQRFTPAETELGHRWNIRLQKLSGNFVGSIGYWEESDTYNPNDMGFVLSPNDRNISGNLRYRWFEPFGSFNRASVGFNRRYNRLYNPGAFQQFDFEAWGFILSKSYFGYNLWVFAQPVEGNDYFEPRTDDFSAYYATPKRIFTGFNMSTDYNRRVALDLHLSYGNFSEPGMYSYSV